MIARLILLTLAVLLLSGFSTEIELPPQEVLLTGIKQNLTISNIALKETALANVRKVNKPICYVSGDTKIAFENSYQLAKEYVAFNNPPAKLVNEFFLPEKITEPTPLEIIDMPLSFCMFGAVATKTITKAPKAVKIYKLTKSNYLNLNPTALLNEVIRLKNLAKAMGGKYVVETISQSERYGKLLFKHRALRKEIKALEILEINTLKAGKKGISILQKIEDKTTELLRTEKSLNKLLENWKF